MNPKHLMHAIRLRSVAEIVGARLLPALILALLLALPRPPANAQSADDGFNPGANASVVAQVVQAMAKEAGFDVKIQSRRF